MSIATAQTVTRSEDLARTFNTAFVSTRAAESQDLSQEIFGLVDTPAFQALMASVQQLSTTQGISEKEAAEELIATFRKLDRLWGEYLIKEGIDRVRRPLN